MYATVYRRCKRTRCRLRATLSPLNDVTCTALDYLVMHIIFISQPRQTMSSEPSELASHRLLPGSLIGASP
ncbi:uncharacterized protein EpC_03160 [Erwinia pyrifoliae Ep1/96]|nr:uncharacterized protein EpC_03160 [Erwinia pyrifoliae Ep1/96]